MCVRKPFAGYHGYRRTAARILCLSVAGILLLSCGDFTLTSGGDNPPKPTPTPSPEGAACENPFQGLTSFKNAKQTELDTTLRDPVALAVVPDGMSFRFTPEGSVSTVQAEAGDILVADRSRDSIYFYDTSSGHKRFVFPSGATEPNGLALYLEEVEVSGTRETIQMLLYTGRSTDSGRYNLFLYDLDDRVPASNPIRIPDDLDFPPILTNWTSPGAVDVGRSGSKRGIFVADNQQTVYRISFEVLTTPTVAVKPKGASRMATGFISIRDLGFSRQTLALYLVETAGSGFYDSVVYKINDALTTGTVQKSQLLAFVPTSQLKTSTGLHLAPTNQDGSKESLLVVSQQATIAVGQFDAVLGGLAQSYLGILDLFHKDVAYDCTHTRIVFTRATIDPIGNAFAPGLYAFTR